MYQNFTVYGYNFTFIRIFYSELCVLSLDMTLFESGVN